VSPNKPQRQRPGGGTTLAPSNESLHVGDVPPVSTEPFEQPPTPTEVEPERTAPADEAPAEPKKPAKAAGKPRKRPASTAPARQAWEASVLLARTDPRGWDPYSVRLPEELWERLEKRVAADQASYRIPKLAMSHYINAALDRVPADAAEAAQMGQDQLASQGLRPPASRSSGTRLHRDVLKRMELLPVQLRRAARPGLLGHLQAAAIAVFLNELDAE